MKKLLHNNHKTLTVNKTVNKIKIFLLASQIFQDRSSIMTCLHSDGWGNRWRGVMTGGTESIRNNSIPAEK